MVAENAIKTNDKESETLKQRLKIMAPPATEQLRTPPQKRRRRGDISLDSIITPKRGYDRRSTGRFARSNFGDNREELKAAERIKTLDGRMLSCFFTKIYAFSNHFTRRDLFEVDGQKFICSEQYYMYYKARVFGDMTTARAIMGAPDGRTMKRLGSNIVGFDLEKWRPVALYVMVIASLKKYEQNADFRQLLFDTGDSIIVETSPEDRYWGVGFFMHDPMLRDIKSWRGINVLGRILMRVRQTLRDRKEFQTPTSAAVLEPTPRKLSSVHKTPVNALVDYDDDAKASPPPPLSRKADRARKRKLKQNVTLNYDFDDDETAEKLQAKATSKKSHIAGRATVEHDDLALVYGLAEPKPMENNDSKSARKQKKRNPIVFDIPILSSLKEAPRRLKSPLLSPKIIDNNGVDSIADIPSQLPKNRQGVLPEVMPPKPPKKADTPPLFPKKVVVPKRRDRISFSLNAKETTARKLTNDGTHITVFNQQRTVVFDEVKTETTSPKCEVILAGAKTAHKSTDSTTPANNNGAIGRKSALIHSRLFQFAVKSIDRS